MTAGISRVARQNAAEPAYAVRPEDQFGGGYSNEIAPACRVWRAPRRVFAATAFAQTYPAKPITIVVPFAAGGPTDTLARLLGEHMRKTLGQPVIVDNTTGAGGSIATAKVVRAPPDGYMVNIGHWGSHVVNGVSLRFRTIC